jgi:hypothetical protein
MVMSCHQNAEQNDNLIANVKMYFENVTKFKYLGTMVTNKNCIQED